jgi:hypothetical protein
VRAVTVETAKDLNDLMEIAPNIVDVLFSIEDGKDMKPIKPNELTGSLTHLTFGDEFHQPVVVRLLPETLTHLAFSLNAHCGPRRIENGALPPNLTHLTLGYNFNHRIENDFFPENLTHLTFGDKFEFLLSKDNLPRKLTHLIVGSNWKRYRFRAGVLPNLTHLKLGDFINQFKFEWFPNSLQKLEISSKRFKLDFEKMVQFGWKTVDVDTSNLVFLK